MESVKRIPSLSLGSKHWMGDFQERLCVYFLNKAGRTI